MIKQVKCPGCRKELRVPAAWLHQPIRCKFCGIVVQLQEKSAAIKPAIPLKAVPPKVPVGKAVSPHAIQTRSPVAPAPAIRGTGPQAAIPLAKRRAATSLPQKAMFAGVWLAGLAAVVTAGILLTNTLNSSEIKEEPKVVAVNNTKPNDVVDVENDETPGKTINRVNARRPKPKPKPPPPLNTVVLPPPPPLRDLIGDTGNDQNFIGGNRPRPSPRPRPGTRPRPTPTPVPSAPVSNAIRNRRMLAINIKNYFYYDAVPPNSFAEVATNFSRAFRMAQVTHFSDVAADPRPPLRSFVVKAITDLLSTSRAQDRIVLLFSGHAVEVEGKPYLVPMDGDQDRPDSLIGLDWLYEELTKCKARQKVVILDICRANPARGEQRRTAGPMSEALDKALANPPAGVQVWTSCAKDQVSYEFNSSGRTNGSIFLNQILQGLADKEMVDVLAKQDNDSTIPIETLAKIVNAKTTEMAKKFYGSEEDEAAGTQTPRLAGKEITDGAAPFNASEPLPPQVVIKKQVAGDVFGAAPRDLVEGILKDLTAITPLKASQADEVFTPDVFPLFPEAVLKDYRADSGEMTPLREAVILGTKALQENSRTLQEVFIGDMNALKQRVQQLQPDLARVRLLLTEALEKMRAAEKDLEKETSKRWKAHFQYVLARLLEREAYIYEYQSAIAQIRTDDLPPLNEKLGHKGWRLAAQERMKAKGAEGRDAKKNAKEAKEILLKIAEEHKGTPWEIFARRDAQNYLGLVWQPTH
ncbi:MAG: hypothetical protein KatS3mg105_0631 [Gemmatales bacterium]|nr:MAG: hypothetical protein KatS3mg105_0631 [Gemmatales bacterium]